MPRRAHARGCARSAPRADVACTHLQVALEETKLSAAELQKILDPVTMVEAQPRAKL